MSITTMKIVYHSNDFYMSLLNKLITIRPDSIFPVKITSLLSQPSLGVFLPFSFSFLFIYSHLEPHDSQVAEVKSSFTSALY